MTITLEGLTSPPFYSLALWLSNDQKI